jgi:hypothetical protein
VKKLGKKLDITIDDSFKIIHGTIDNGNPRTMYINISSWVDLTEDKDISISKIIDKLHRRIKNNLFYKIDKNIFDNKKVITDFTLKESGITNKKRSFLSCEITVFQNTLNSFNTVSVLNELNNITNIILNEMKSSKNFKFYKTKK